MPAKKKAVRKKAPRRKTSAPPDGPFEPATAQAMDGNRRRIAQPLPGRRLRARLGNPPPTAHRDDPLGSVNRRARQRSRQGPFQEIHVGQGLRRGKPDVFEEDIRSTGFSGRRRRTSWPQVGSSRKSTVARFPQNLDSLVQLPGVARKTANVVLGTAFGIPSGFVVDNTR